MHVSLKLGRLGRLLRIRSSRCIDQGCVHETLPTMSVLVHRRWLDWLVPLESGTGGKRFVGLVGLWMTTGCSWPWIPLLVSWSSDFLCKKRRSLFPLQIRSLVSWRATTSICSPLSSMSMNAVLRASFTLCLSPEKLGIIVLTFEVPNFRVEIFFFIFHGA